VQDLSGLLDAIARTVAHARPVRRAVFNEPNLLAAAALQGPGILGS